MDYQETIDYLFTRLPMFSRIGSAAYKATLDNTIKLCASLGNPQMKFKTIHVAGTNGKGSVCHMLASILHTRGYKVGLYTSPHLKDFRERIKTSGEQPKTSEGLIEISQEFVIDFTKRIKPLIEEIEPSFFEITVAMAFDYFAFSGIDFAVVEVGLGGRLDSTNIIQPEVSVITNIGWDHMNILGNTLAKIAFEKAGIIKPNVPVVVGEFIPESAEVITRVAAEKQAPLFIASRRRSAINWNWEKHELVVEVTEEHHTDHKKYHLDLPGIYQRKNLLTVLETIDQLNHKGHSITYSQTLEALAHVKKLTGLHGRWEIIRNHPLIIVDVAHNADGIEQLMQQLEVTEHRQLHIVIGLVKDKEAEKIMSLLPPTAHYYFTKAQIPRALPEDELARIARDSGLKGNAWPDVNKALEVANSSAHAEDLIIVCGSVFLVGEIAIGK